MAIARTFRGAAGQIDRAGEYRVTVEKMEVGKSKSGKPMLTLTFCTDEERRIKGYYVQSLVFHMKALDELKLACGLLATAPADQLVGKRCGIAVGEQPPTQDGKVFMQIEGYGKEQDAEVIPYGEGGGLHPFGGMQGGAVSDDNVPF
jgi:hypothetical protein